MSGAVEAAGASRVARLVDSFRTRGGLPRIRKARAARIRPRSVRVCVNETKKHYICAEMAALYECLYVCCIVTVYVYVCVQTQSKVCVFHCTALRALMM